MCCIFFFFWEKLCVVFNDRIYLQNYKNKLIIYNIFDRCSRSDTTILSILEKKLTISVTNVQERWHVVAWLGSASCFCFSFWLQRSSPHVAWCNITTKTAYHKWLRQILRQSGSEEPQSFMVSKSKWSDVCSNINHNKISFQETILQSIPTYTLCPK